MCLLYKGYVRFCSLQGVKEFRPFFGSVEASYVDRVKCKRLYGWAHIAERRSGVYGVGHGLIAGEEGCGPGKAS